MGMQIAVEKLDSFAQYAIEGTVLNQIMKSGAQERRLREMTKLKKTKKKKKVSSGFFALAQFVVFL
jgi:hypothetical protein